jgi:broad specificity phosphatase PhoE
MNGSKGTEAKCAAMMLLSVFALFNSAAAQEGGTLAGQALVDALRAGGFNLYFRHAATDWSADDRVAKAGDWTSCDPKKMRQLSAAGRETTRSTGNAMRALGIPVGLVYASPYCRTVETARALALGNVETTTDIMNLRVADYFGGSSAIAESTRRRLSAFPKAGTNTVLVAHGNVIKTATGEYPGEGEAVVFHPDGTGGFSVVARVRPADWGRLAAAYSKPRVTR